MATKRPLVDQLKRILSTDPRTAILLVEILGPPPGLSVPARRTPIEAPPKSDERSK